MLFLKLPFAIKPGLTDSDFAKMQSNIGLIFRCQGVKVSQGGCSSANRQVIRIDTSQNRQDRFGVARFAKLY